MSEPISLYDYHIVDFNEVEPSERLGQPVLGILLVAVRLDFCPPDMDVIGHSAEITLRFPYDADVTIATLKEMVRAELPGFLAEASSLSAKHIPEGGGSVHSETGLS